MPRPRRPRVAAKRYWIGYCRKSTDTEDKQIHSLQDQAVMVERYYANLPPEERRYPLRLLQEARSAYRPGRPTFKSILQLADAGEVHGLIVVHPNRVSRNHADSGAFVQRLVEGTIRSLDTTTGKRYTGKDSNDIFMLTLEGAMSWKDSRDKGDRIREAMRMRAREGKIMGPIRPGYNKCCRPDGTRVVEIVPAVAPKIRRLFELACSHGYSVSALAHEARRMDLRTRKGHFLVPSAIHAMLRDPVYMGFVRFDGILTRGSHPALVEESLWHRTQAALDGRRTSAERQRDDRLRDLFVFGRLLSCPHCRRALSGYRVKGKYIYYECKNKQTRCRVIVPQVDLIRQLESLLEGIRLSDEQLKSLREMLLEQHRRRSGTDREERRSLNAQYENVVHEIGNLFSQRQQAAALGVLEQVDQRLVDLARRRDELQGQLNAGHQDGSDWVENVIGSFRLIELLQEAIFTGSAHPRELALRALASNYTLEGKKLLADLRSPFRQWAENRGHPEWSTVPALVRTQVRETAAMLEGAYGLFLGSKDLAAG